MTKILVLADSHLHDAFDLPDSLFYRAQKCDLIVHCGDIVSSEIITALSAVKPVRFVRGNGDYRSEFPKAGFEEVFEVEEMTAGITHGTGTYGSIDRLRAKFPQKDVNLIFFGHTHKRFYRHENGVHYVNPGSISSPRDGARSYAIVNVKGREVDVKFVFVKDSE